MVLGWMLLRISEWIINIFDTFSVPKNKRRRKNDRRQGRDRRGDYYEEASPAPSSSNPRDARYNDMAPKNWDNAPPRYQNPVAPPSSEYERPPPYYYR